MPADPQVRSWAEGVLASRPTIGRVRLVVVDGPAGSGKTTLAAGLATVLTELLDAERADAGTARDVVVVDGDSLYEGWPVVAGEPDRVAAFAVLGDRVQRWLLDPWSRGQAASFPRWDWVAQRWGETRVLAAPAVAILAGVSLGSRPLRRQASLSIWIEADDDVRVARVLERDGPGIAEPMRSWVVDERRWFTRDRTAQECDVAVRT